MTPRERVIAVLIGGQPDRVPFTWKMPYERRGHIERELRNDGMALIWRCEVVNVERPNVEVIRHEYRDHGQPRVRETFCTPTGKIIQVWAIGGGYGSQTRHEHLVRSPDDYEVVEFIIRDEVYTSNDTAYRRAHQIMGDDGFVFGGWMPPSPIMVMLWEWLGPMQFSMHLVDHPELFERLYELLLDRQIEQYRIAAQSSALVIHAEENLTADMLGRERFERYCMPAYEAFANVLHKHGKLLAEHFDGELKPIADLIGRSAVDIVEAFTPAPDTKLELSDALHAWSDKITWINFPSSVHLMPVGRVEEHTRHLLQQSAPSDRFLIGVTEDIPEGAWDISMPAIHRVVKQEGGLPIQ